MYAVLFFSVFSATVVVAKDWPFQSYVTEHFKPPQFTVNKTGLTTDGYLFFAAVNNTPSTAPAIMEDSGELIWHPDWSTTNKPVDFFEWPQVTQVDVQQLDGKNYLTFFRGLQIGSSGYGAISVLDETYQRQYRICLKPENMVTAVANLTFPCYNDLHESQFTDRGTILQTAYNYTQIDLSSVGGPKDGWVMDSQFYEIDIKTNEVKFVWKSLDHLEELPLNLTHYPLSAGNGSSQYTPLDYLHTNAVSALPDGGYLLSARHFWMAIKLDKNGKVEWTLPGDGHKGSFAHIDPKIRFSWQHHIRASNVTNSSMLLHMHDNANSEVSNGTSPTAGLLLSLELANPANRTAVLLHNYTDPNDLLYVTAEGSYQPLPDGHVLLGHGQIPEIKEYSREGDILMTVRFGEDDQTSSYRAYRYPWVGKPTWPPKAQAASTNGSKSLYMSWNGATEYDQWMVFVGSSVTDTRWVTNVTRHGFETSTPLVNETSGYARAIAVHKGTAVGETAVMPF